LNNGKEPIAANHPREVSRRIPPKPEMVNQKKAFVLMI